MSHVIACIDGSAAADTICDHAAWAARRLDAPLMLLHVLDEERYPSEPNLSGSIGLGTREALLKELADLDARRNRLALEEGKALLEAAKERLASAGQPTPVLRQRHGKLLDAVRELDDETRLLVIGKQGTDHPGHDRIGDNVEKLIRGVDRSVLVAVGAFKAPTGLMLAYDNSPSMRDGVRLIASSPLLRELPCHLVQVNGSERDREGAAWAARRLEDNGHPVTVAALKGDVETELHLYQEEHDLDLVVMGAYGHSRIREFLIGSTTDRLIRHARVPHLILR
ncbi:universal stress protein [Alloalcanivorax sp. C16-2]|uniref:universal stress protein n=1 Tax=Alloalcanivorax TaxID=3020832 RepID=UPI0019330F06|nr:universal stress protein [Alloalcanivorax marinus]MBL7251677.1 universal stress protein [Alloalcanivorax marinus]